MASNPNPYTQTPIQIQTWKDDTPGMSNPVVTLQRLDTDTYDAAENAKQVARLFDGSLPGNTIDILYGAIATEILAVIDSAIILKRPGDIEHRIRSAMHKLAGDE